MTLGSRLKEERERLGLSQSQLGQLGLVTKLSQFNYEAGKSNPSSNYFEEVDKIGIDIYYVITGKRKNDRFENDLSDDEKQLVFAYRQSHELIKNFVITSLINDCKKDSNTVKVSNVSGKVTVANKIITKKK